MSDEPPRVIAIQKIVSVTSIDGDLAVAVEMRTPDNRAFAVILGNQLAAELRDLLNEGLREP